MKPLTGGSDDGSIFLEHYITEKLMDAHDVSPIVNSAKYDGPECIRPVSDDDTPRTGQLSLF
jgi:hypothetical protein